MCSNLRSTVGKEVADVQNAVDGVGVRFDQDRLFWGCALGYVVPISDAASCNAGGYELDSTSHLRFSVGMPLGKAEVFTTAGMARIAPGFDPAMKVAFEGLGLIDMLH